MKILFINKTNFVVLELDSKFSKINLDIHIFKYLICFMVLKLHEKKHKQIELKIEIDNNNFKTGVSKDSDYDT